MMARSIPRVQRTDLVRLGSRYGGWVVPEGMLSSGSICYCAGVGEDISFDLAIIERFGVTVYAMDPTPRASTYVDMYAPRDAKFHFIPEGLWSADTTLRFYSPVNPDDVSHSAVNLQGTDTYFEASVRSITSLMEDFGHERIDLLKIDIEGSEYEVIGDVLKNDVEIGIFCIEFDQPAPLRRTTSAIRSLIDAGYAVVSIEGWNVTLVNTYAPGQRPIERADQHG